MTVMRDLSEGAEFRLAPQYSVSTRYRITVPASAHPRGWIEVTDVDMTDDEAQRRIAAGWADDGCDPRDVMFVTGQTGMEIEVLP